LILLEILTMANATELRLAQLAALAEQPKTTQNTASDAKRPKAKLYLNIGYVHPTEGRINLPFNLSLDHMSNKDVKGSDDWAVKAHLANDLLAMLRDLVSGIEPGQAIELPANFTIEAYHAKVDEGPSESTVDRLAAARAAMPQLSFGN
jgi:hypothetical protein